MQSVDGTIQERVLLYAMNEAELLEQLQRTRHPVANISLPAKPGIYAIFLRHDSCLPGFAEGGQLIYLGKAEKSLANRDQRQHFKIGETGHSTVRRSVPEAGTRRRRGYRGISPAVGLCRPGPGAIAPGRQWAVLPERIHSRVCQENNEIYHKMLAS